MKRRILYFSEHNLQAYQVYKQTCLSIQTFENTPEGIADFVSYLLTDKNIPICCLMDTLQEEFHAATIPHILGKDRQNLLIHRKKRLFDRIDYTYATLQGREITGRGDDKVLFSALSNIDILQPWLELILAHKIPVVGIYSVPILSQILLKYLPKNKHYLMVVPSTPLNTHAMYGLRQSFFIEQGLQFSRLSALSEFDINHIIEQIKKTERYLVNSRLLPHNEKMTVLLLDNTQISGILYNHDNLTIERITLESLADKMGLIEFDKPLYLHHLLVYYLATHRIKNHYARTQDIRYYLYRLFNRGLKLVASSLVLVALAITSGYAYQSWQVWLSGNKTSVDIEVTKAELARKRAELPQLTTDIVVIRNVVDVGRYVQSQQLSPQLVLQRISEVLTQSDHLSFEQKGHLQLERMEWGVGDNLGQIFEGETTAKEVPVAPPPPPIRPAFGQMSLSSRFTPPPTKPATPETYVEAIRVHGKIEPFDGNYPQARALFNLVIQALSQQKEWTVTPLVSPYDTNPQSRLQGQIGQTQKSTPQAPFAFEIQIKHPYARKTS